MNDELSDDTKKKFILSLMIELQDHEEIEKSMSTSDDIFPVTFPIK